MPTFVFSIQDRRRIHLGDILLLKYPSKIWVEESYIKVMRDGGGGGMRHADYIMKGIGALALMYLYVHGIILIN